MKLKDHLRKNYSDCNLSIDLQVQSYNEESKESAKQLFEKLQNVVEEHEEGESE